MDRIEEFTLDGKNFMYIDFSGLKTSADFLALTNVVMAAIKKYPHHSLNTITNIENMRIDSDSKGIMTEYMAHNKPFVKFGVITGMDGIKKVMANSVFKAVGRTNMSFAFSREQAIEMLLKKED